MRILVAEDEKELNRLLSARLKAENYSVDSCFDGEGQCRGSCPRAGCGSE